MDIFSILMFVAVGLAAAHVAHKTGEGEFALLPALVLGLAGALTGGIGASAAGMNFYVPGGSYRLKERKRLFHGDDPRYGFNGEAGAPAPP